tara:strand:- start:707 stop:1405 length:699 start_codon:yes stop_codon:yes gene_type:complete
MKQAPANSMSFDGAGDFVAFTETTFNIEDTGDFLTIAFWAKRTDNNDEAVILGNSATGSFKRLYFDSDGDRLIMEGDANGQDASGVVTADTDWHHYAITLVGVSGGAQAVVVFYEDGNAVSTTITNLGVNNNKDFTVNRIGADVVGGTREFKGLLYQVAIWNAKLEANEVSAIFNSGIPIPLQSNRGNYVSAGNLAHLWRFDEGSGSTASDSVGNLNGTITNATFSTTTPTS